MLQCVWGSVVLAYHASGQAAELAGVDLRSRKRNARRQEERQGESSGATHFCFLIDDLSEMSFASPKISRCNERREDRRDVASGPQLGKERDQRKRKDVDLPKRMNERMRKTLPNQNRWVLEG